MTQVEQYLQERRNASKWMTEGNEKALQQCNERSRAIYNKFTKNDFLELIQKVENKQAKQAFSRAMHKKYPD